MVLPSSHYLDISRNAVVGCWCGFPTRFNPKFKDLAPLVLPRPQTMRQNLSPRGIKRKRPQALSQLAKSHSPSDLTESDGTESESELSKAEPNESSKRPRTLVNYTEISDSSEDNEGFSPSKAPVHPSQQNVRTVVIGAGVVGLFVALNLAADARRLGITRAITVISTLR